MKIKYILTVMTAGVLVSCSTESPISRYAPASGPERVEFRNDRLDIYPEDVRKVPALFDKYRLAWAGIIVSNDSQEVDFDGIRMKTVFEHHYYDWVEDAHGGGKRLLLSPRGEGRFRMTWHVDRNDPLASDQDAAKFAAPGKMAIVYATPVSVDEDGTIVMKYHYARILSPKHYTISDIDYGRIGEEPFRAISKEAVTNTPSH